MRLREVNGLGRSGARLGKKAKVGTLALKYLARRKNIHIDVKRPLFCRVLGSSQFYMRTIGEGKRTSTSGVERPALIFT